MSKSPDARPASAEAFGRALQGVEAELRLAQTPLEVASTVSAPVDRTDEDATRVRGVRVIDPQPVEEATRFRSSITGPAPGGDTDGGATRARPGGVVDDPTRTRPAAGVADLISLSSHPGPGGGRRRTVDAPELVVPEATAEPAADSAAPSRRNLVVGAAVVVVVAVVVAVVASVVGSGTDRAASDDDAQPYSAEEQMTDFVPAVVDLQAARVDADSVRWTWTAPADVADFVWRRCDGSSDQSTATKETSVVVTGLGADARACVAVTAVDGGATSEEKSLDWPLADATTTSVVGP